MIIRILLAGAVAALANAPASAADWRLTAMRPTNYGLSLSFVDASSITGGYGQVQFVGLTYFNRQTHKMNRMEVLVRADCETLTFRFARMTAFRNQQPTGQWQSTGPVAAKPGSNVFDQILSACGRLELGMHVNRPEAVAANYFRGLPKRRAARHPA